jgi:hypothetical protein
MIEVTLNDGKKESMVRKYPYVGVSCLGDVILFTAPKKGVALAFKTLQWDIGRPCDCWAEKDFVLVPSLTIKSFTE